MRISRDQKIISALLSNKAPKKYQGKEVVVLDGKVYQFPEDDKQAANFFNKLIKRNLGKTPTLVDVPKANMTYILSTIK